jgi:hypothetical protein
MSPYGGKADISQCRQNAAHIRMDVVGTHYCPRGFACKAGGEAGLAGLAETFR